MRIQDKFECISLCVKKLSKAIRESTGKPASADEILPVLTYVILRANPAMLISNMRFIEYFSLKFKSHQGETGKI
jgi:hypothetical protein